ncbi:MAG: IgGFc-binding protein, partial [Paludibacteraceae bacterium]|nr:IgGFc-binding protein [Paludibacteraceae bacterium]
MKKQIFLGILICLMLVPTASMQAQSTEGTDFWVTLMRGDAGNYDELSLTFSAHETTKVFIENIYYEYYDTVTVEAGSIEQLSLNTHVSSCYVTDADAEKVSNHALHVTSEKPISLIAANYKNKSFDVASILPTRALMNEYRIQCYDPYSHSGTAQGSHFAIVAAEDDVVVDVTPTVYTSKGKSAGQTFATDTLQRGQVYYVWTGNGSGSSKDFTGTVVKARDNKKIAVFNGNSHTNIPSKEDRDHIYSQAMPINYWCKRFAITSSLTT